MRLFHSLSVCLFCAAVSVVGFADDAVVLPSGYVQLDHVTFDSSAYVKTGLTPENGWKIAVDFEPKEVTTGGNLGTRDNIVLPRKKPNVEIPVIEIWLKK